MPLLAMKDLSISTFLPASPRITDPTSDPAPLIACMVPLAPARIALPAPRKPPAMDSAAPEKSPRMMDEAAPVAPFQRLAAAFEAASPTWPATSLAVPPTMPATWRPVSGLIPKADAIVAKRPRFSVSRTADWFAFGSNDASFADRSLSTGAPPRAALMDCNREAV